MLAIVIPYYKIIFFEKTLESLAQQTNKRFRVYIGDDASPDSPEKLLEKYQGKFNFTYKKFNDNLGSISLVKQWERCIDMMKDEEWLMILGDDDVLGDNVVEEFYNNLSMINEVSNVVRFATEVIDEKSEVLHSKFIHPKKEWALDSFFRKISGKTRSSLSEYVFNSKIFRKKGFVDLPLAWGTDDLAVLDISEKKPIYTINCAIVQVRVSLSSISGKKDNLLLKNKAILQQGSYILKKHENQITLEKRKQLIDYLEYNIYSTGTKDLISGFKLTLLGLYYVDVKCFFNLIKTLFYRNFHEKYK